MNNSRALYAIPYYLWLIFFVILPMGFILVQSFIGQDGLFTLENYVTYFTTPAYLEMTLNSIWAAFLITVFALLIGYPAAYVMSRFKKTQLLILLVILPMWVNLLLKAYAFIGIFSRTGIFNDFLGLLGLPAQHILFTSPAFILTAAYIELPFMILPIYNSLRDISPSYIEAASDLGANAFEVFRKIIFPLSLNGVRSGVQTVFIPSLSLFMIARIIGGNKIITLGTAVEQHFLVTQNWGMGSTIGVVLMVMMFVLLFLLRSRKKGGQQND